MRREKGKREISTVEECGDEFFGPRGILRLRIPKRFQDEAIPQARDLVQKRRLALHLIGISEIKLNSVPGNKYFRLPPASAVAEAMADKTARPVRLRWGYGATSPPSLGLRRDKPGEGEWFGRPGCLRRFQVTPGLQPGR